MSPKMIRAAGIACGLTFAGVGTIFLFSPDAVLRLMNSLGRSFGLPEAPLAGAGFYLALAVGYMAVVTILSFMMVRQPGNPAYALLLSQAKGASSLLSIGLFFFHQRAFVYLANGIVDGALGLFAFLIYRSVRKSPAAARS
ncbi:MAG: hypothetical protein NTZ26_10390 [Candidatus Aminicenantes bacterium]|nr:hypothetical protein [Candidatus Aminicenantes bacterium]